MSFQHFERTPLGTVQTKVNGLGITLASVPATIYDTIIVMVGMKKQSGAGVAPTVTWGSYTMEEVVWRNNGGTQTGAGIFMLDVPVNDTLDIVATYGATVTAQCMVASSITTSTTQDVFAQGIDDASTTPSSPNLPTRSYKRNFVVGFLFVNRPATHDFGTMTGLNARQSTGTTGGGPISNVAILEGVKRGVNKNETISIGATGAGSGDWVSAITNIGRTKIGSHSISMTDVDFINNMFANKLTPIPITRVAFRWNRDLSRFEAWDTDVISGTLVAYQNEDNVWIEV